MEVKPSKTGRRISISFSKYEDDLYKYVKSQNNASDYIKALVKQDMNSEDDNHKDSLMYMNMIKGIADIMKQVPFELNTTGNTNSEKSNECIDDKQSYNKYILDDNKTIDTQSDHENIENNLDADNEDLSIIEDVQDFCF